MKGIILYRCRVRRNTLKVAFHPCVQFQGIVLVEIHTADCRTLQCIYFFSFVLSNGGAKVRRKEGKNK